LKDKILKKRINDKKKEEEEEERPKSTP